MELGPKTQAALEKYNKLCALAPEMVAKYERDHAAFYEANSASIALQIQLRTDVSVYSEWQATSNRMDDRGAQIRKYQEFERDLRAARYAINASFDEEHCPSISSVLRAP